MGYRYIGSKSRIVEKIIKIIGKPQKSGCFIDAFSGTGCISAQAANIGWKIKANDILNSAVIMTTAGLLCYEDITFKEFGGYKEVISFLNNLKGTNGFFWKEYSPASKNFQTHERRYFTEYNAKKIDAISRIIHKWKKEKKITDFEFALLMADVISATNDVANIAGTYGCFLSKWTDQSQKKLQLTERALRQNKVEFSATNLDAFSVESTPNDIIYFDPPYTKRQYASYYHILETLVIGDKPQIEGVAGLRPWKNKSSVFCYKTKAHKALVDLISAQKAHRVILSYSDEGHVNLDELSSDLKKIGTVKTIQLDTIGRYTPNINAVKNNQSVKEYLIDFKRK